MTETEFLKQIDSFQPSRRDKVAEVLANAILRSIASKQYAALIKEVYARGLRHPKDVK